ncbi:predicted protein [Nematostella vectensis]|uniref:Luciferin 4-monooxygenase n=1 Tax=Nematostella vectensis TaxID=45351 RepID=A7RPW4_NEMVE|nr:4-coumarate--CoA ligase 1 [Nematostella vectensis]EDO46392.1 predicted protein [Nematostella vectensis]|eukprot:XP_001638455.1 predicted protein [Nematostella vectensis]
MSVVRSKLPDIPIPDDVRSFPRFMLQKFAEYGDEKALIDSATGKSFTFSELCTLIRKCGSVLVRRGAQIGDTMAVILPNMIEYPVVCYGALSVGMRVTTLNPQYTVREMVPQLKDSQANYIITTPELIHQVNQAAAKCSCVRRVFVLADTPGHQTLYDQILNDDGSAFPSHVPVNWKQDVAYILYSSGTTGLPKGVLLTHYNLISAVVILNNFWAMTSEQTTEASKIIQVLIVPMFHVFGLAIMLGINIAIGVTMVCIRQFDPVSFLEAIQKYKVTNISVVPPLLIFLAKHPSVLKYDLSSVKSVGCGAAPLGEEMMDAFMSRFPNVESNQGYGLTEFCVALIGRKNLKKPASVGEVLPCSQVKVVDLKTGVAQPAGKQGEICIKGPLMMKGYLNNPEATANTIDHEGWLHTGDIGYYDDQEHFYIVGRVKELIKYKGFQVPPAELEDLLQSHPDIADAAVIGVPDEEAGELPKAFVVLKAGTLGTTPQDIIQFVSENISPQKRLRGGVEIVDSIPKTPSGKILRRQLREQEVEKRKMKHKL